MGEENVAIRESAAGRSIVRNFRIICWKPGAPPAGELEGLAGTTRLLTRAVWYYERMLAAMWRTRAAHPLDLNKS